jgi:hypothetical protein
MARMAGEQAMARMATEKIAPTPATYTIWHTYPSLDFLRGLTALQSDTNLLPGIEKGIVRDGRRHEADYRISVGLRPS